MPYCRDCGNSIFFTSSMVSPAAPAATGPASGLVGRFDDDGALVEMDSLGADDEIRRHAVANPLVYFNTCMECGSTNVAW